MWQKTDNTCPEAKVMLRMNMLKLADRASVLDLFQGKDKKMYKACYQVNPHVVKYKGYDIIADEVENRLDNKKAIFIENLDDYNFFDLDAYGSPWELFFNVVIRFQKGGQKTFVVTDGLFFRNQLSGATQIQRAILNIPRKFLVPCLHRHHRFFLARMFYRIEELTGFKLQTFKQSYLSGMNMKYYGFQLNKV